MRAFACSGPSLYNQPVQRTAIASTIVLLALSATQGCRSADAPAPTGENEASADRTAPTPETADDTKPGDAKTDDAKTDDAKTGDAKTGDAPAATTIPTFALAAQLSADADGDATTDGDATDDTE